MEVLIRGMFNKSILMDLLRHFIVFEKDEVLTHKMLAAYHQYHAVNKAVDTTMIASSSGGDQRCGVCMAHSRIRKKSYYGILFR